MRNTHYLSLITVLLTTAVACPTHSSNGVSAHALPAGEVFRTHEKREDYYQLITGRIDYKESPEGDGQEGYLLTTSEEIKGSHKRRVIDYDKRDSAIRLYQKMLQQLASERYRIVYRCSGAECGDVQGWQLYLSKYLDGDIDRQHYVVATRPAGSQAQQYRVFYVNDLDGQPRSVIDDLVANKAPVAGIEKESAHTELDTQLQTQGRVALRGVYFDFNESALDERSEPALKNVAHLLQERAELKLYVVGHADNSGSYDYNIDLSLRRAKAVKEYLQRKYAIEQDRLVAKGVGFLAPAEENYSEEGRSKNRRVELVAMR